MRFVFILLLAVITLAARAQSTAFTYQGQLKNAGEMAAGLHDFRFSLFDAASGGSQVGATQCLDNILVSEGIFTATVDFGQQFATTSPRFLQIEVRADTGLTCANLAGFVVLGQRQVLTATPMATYAKVASTAFSLSAPDGSPANAVFVDDSGKVGIGTIAPTHSLHIATSGPTIALQDTNLASQQVGYISYRDIANVERAWVGYGSRSDPDFSIVNTRPSGDIVLLPFNGNVGIGTSTPASKLEVHGDIRLGPNGQLRATAGEEKLRIIRGEVSPSGNVVYGVGFTAERVSTGRYWIHFDTPFSNFPTGVAMVAPVTGEATKFVERGPALAFDKMLIDIYKRSDGSFVDASFMFIIMGPD